jgi:hypothetical protein
MNVRAIETNDKRGAQHMTGRLISHIRIIKILIKHFNKESNKIPKKTFLNMHKT